MYECVSCSISGFVWILLNALSKGDEKARDQGGVRSREGEIDYRDSYLYLLAVS